MLILRLAFRNIMGRGIRTWLNVFVLSLAFIVIILAKGMIEGWSRDAMNAMIDSELGGGQYWHQGFDRYDPLTFEDSYALMTAEQRALVSGGRATPILMTTGAIFPDGRVRTVVLRGIDPDQRILNLPAGALKNDDPAQLPALIGARMAEQTGLSLGDYVTLRWRDKDGTFDADDIRIAEIMTTMVPSIDQGQIWLPLDRLQRMLRAPGEATLVVMEKNSGPAPAGNGAWIYRDLDYLLEDFQAMIKAKSGGSNFFYGLLLFMGLLAVFDTQILSIWRRRREIGTLMALGMDRFKIVALFTTEGALHGCLALLVGAVYGLPLLSWSLKGWPMPDIATDMGVVVPARIYPAYGSALIVGTCLVVLIAVTVVSFLPVVRLTRLKPTEALRGSAL